MTNLTDSLQLMQHLIVWRDVCPETREWVVRWGTNDVSITLTEGFRRVDHIIPTRELENLFPYVRVLDRTAKRLIEELHVAVEAARRAQTQVRKETLDGTV